MDRAKLTDQQLAEMALAARRKSYSPYSRFKVGAAIEGEKDVYVGSNVENKSYGLTVCAERVAVFTAVMNKDTSFRRIAIASSKVEPIPPCGACLQVMSEFVSDLKIILVGAKGKIKRTSLKKLYPMAYARIK